MQGLRGFSAAQEQAPPVLAHIPTWRAALAWDLHRCCEAQPWKRADGACHWMHTHTELAAGRDTLLLRAPTAVQCWAASLLLNGSLPRTTQRASLLACVDMLLARCIPLTAATRPAAAGLLVPPGAPPRPCQAAPLSGGLALPQAGCAGRSWVQLTEQAGPPRCGHGLYQCGHAHACPPMCCRPVHAGPARRG